MYSRPQPFRRTVAYQLYPHVMQAIPAHWRSFPSRHDDHPVFWHTRLCLFRSSDPLQLQEVTTRGIYRRIVKAKVESPVSQDSWSALWTLSAVQWDSLWSIPNDPFLAPFQKDILWKFLHRVLPTHYRIHRWGLSQSADCLACHSSTPDTIDHIYGDCPIWRDVLQRALSFLHMLQCPTNRLSGRPGQPKTFTDN